MSPGRDRGLPQPVPAAAASRVHHRPRLRRRTAGACGRRARGPRLRPAHPRGAAACGALSHVPRGPDPSERGADRRDRLRSPRREALHADADRAGEDLRRPGGDRHRERAALHGAGGPQPRPDGDPRAADRHQRDPARHLQLADRHPARVRRGRRERARASARRTTLQSSVRTATLRARRPPRPEPTGDARRAFPSVDRGYGRRAARCSTGSAVHDSPTSRQRPSSSRSAGLRAQSGIGPCSRPVDPRGPPPSARSSSGATEVRPSPTSRSRSSRPSPTRRSSPSRTCGSSRSWRPATAT